MVIARNKKKKNLLNLLTSTNTVYGTAPYRMFYFSCNLEHVLHDERQVERIEKIKYSAAFQDKYIENVDGFIELICNSDFTVKKEYQENWNFIKKDNNSIGRFSNFNILLDDYLGGDV